MQISQHPTSIAIGMNMQNQSIRTFSSSLLSKAATKSLRVFPDFS